MGEAQVVFRKGLFEVRQPTKTSRQAAKILKANRHRYYEVRLVNIPKSNIYQENTLLVVRTMVVWYPRNHLTWG